MELPDLTKLKTLLPAAIFLPEMSVKAFAKAQDMTTEAVRTQIREGNLPAIKRGKYLYVNLVALSRMCSEEHERQERKIQQAAH